MCERDLGKQWRNLMMVGMACLAIGLILPWVLPVSGSIGRDWVHGISGWFVGMSISLNLIAVFKGSQWRRARNS